jgi:hypothetical protein
MAVHAPAPAIATATTASEMICTLSRMTPALALSPRIPPTVCHDENARRATLVAAGSYGVDAAFRSLVRRGCHIHAVAPATAVLNNLINARASVPVTVTPARTTGTGPGGGPGYAFAGG